MGDAERREERERERCRVVAMMRAAERMRGAWRLMQYISVCAWRELGDAAPGRGTAAGLALGKKVRRLGWLGVRRRRRGADK